MDPRLTTVLEVESLPTLAVIRAARADVGQRLIGRLEMLTAEELETETEYGFPVEDKSIMGTAGSLSQHDSYHIGTFGLLAEASRPGRPVVRSRSGS